MSKAKKTRVTTGKLTLIAVAEIHSKTQASDIGATHDSRNTSGHTESGAFIVNT